MKLLLDEMYWPVLADQLALRGHDVISATADASLTGMSDEDLFTAAQVAGRTIVTENVGDFIPIVDLDHGDGLLARVVSLHRRDQYVRQPGMSGLGDRHVVLVGAGALGSQIAAHLTRAGVGQLDIIDPELLEAGNVVRNELTLSDAGWPKAEALALHLQSINPFLRVRTSLLRIGSVGTMNMATEAQTQHDEWAQAVAGAQLVVNATAAPAPGRWLAALGDALRTPVLHAAVSAGAWGARVHIQRPGASGCPECLARHQDANDGVVPTWSADPNGDAVVGRGCSQPSFAAPGFELAEAAAAATRASVQVLLDGDGYPPLDFDIATLTFRDEHFSRPSTSHTPLPRHPECQCCAL